MAASTLARMGPSRFGLSSVLPRLIWKEYRSLRGLWIGLVMLAPLLAIFSSMILDRLPEDMRTNREAPMVAFMFTFPIMFAVGSSALLFAAEKEDRTWNLLRFYPFHKKDVFLAKILVGLLGTVSISLLLSSMLYVLLWFGWEEAGRQRLGYDSVSSFLNAWHVGWERGFQLAVQGFAWGVFFSLLTSRTLATLFLAPLAALMAVYSVFPIAMLVVALVADGWLARHWLDERNARWYVAPTVRRVTRLPQRVLFISDAAYPAKVAFARLVWLEWKNARRFFAFALAAGVLIFCIDHPVTFGGLHDNRGISVIFSAILPLLAGAWSYHGEQQLKRFRIPSQRGVSPGAVWLSKHAVWIPLTVLMLFALLLADYSFRKFIRHSVVVGRLNSVIGIVTEVFSIRDDLYPMTTVIGRMFGWVLLAYGCGQFVSMLIPRTITAALVSLPLLWFSTLWWIIVTSYEIPVLITVGPVIVILFAASLVRAPDWLAERSGWHPWLKLTGVVVIPMMILLIGVELYMSVSSTMIRYAAPPVSRRGAAVAPRDRKWLSP